MTEEWAFISDTEWRRRTQGISLRRADGLWSAWFPNGNPVMNAAGEQAQATDPKTLARACDLGELPLVLQLKEA